MATQQRASICVALVSPDSTANYVMADLVQHQSLRPIQHPPPPSAPDPAEFLPVCHHRPQRRPSRLASLDAHRNNDCDVQALGLPTLAFIVFLVRKRNSCFHARPLRFHEWK